MQKYLSITHRLWKLLTPFHKHFYIQLGGAIVQQIIGIGVTYMAARMLDALVTHNTQFLPWFIAIYFLASVVRNRISYYTQEHSLIYIDNAIQQYLEEYSFEKIFSLNASQYAEGHSSIRLQVINRGENAIENIISTIVLTLLPTASQILFSIIAIGFYSPIIALWSFVTVIILIIWSNHFSTFHRPYVKENIENWDIQRKVRTEAFQHLTLIKIAAAENRYLKKYLANRLSRIKHSVFTWGLSLKHGHRRGLFTVISRTGNTVLMFTLAIRGAITVGGIYAIWSWMNDAYNNIQSIVQALRQIPLRFVELEKYLEIVDTEKLFNEHGKKNTPLAEAIIFSHVAFKYPYGEKNVFDDLSFSIPAGKKVAFVGSSGSGKSTVIKILLRIYNYETGSIRIGNTDLNTIDARYLRQHTGYVEQHVDLFDDTIKENILIGVAQNKLKEAEDRLEEVAQRTRISEFYHRLGEERFNTIVGERGIKLSGGERQRIGIARAIIKDPEILIFDEATSSLDTENEAKVMEAIDDVSEGKTTIIIAHRLSTVRNADKIIVMDKGKVVGEGTHDELMENSPVYQNLVAHQLS
jgi:ABC-type multidrug transport system fused ATPase/permease subunit